LGKVPVEVKECAGFLVNRLLGIYANEALYMLEEQFPPELIDQAALDLGMPMGPLRLGDMAGWDVIYHANQSLYEEYGARFTLPRILPDMIKAGKLGQKTGDGIYIPDKTTSVELVSSDDDRLQDLSNRLLYVMLNEGIRCLEERVASAQDIDLAMQLGTGMPRGPISWADELGLDVLFDGLEQLKAQHGERYRPSPLLRRKVQASHIGIKSAKGLNTSK
jgi:3-hydroxyacyl-CoA dehydrogenase